MLSMRNLRLAFRELLEDGLRMDANAENADASRLVIPQNAVCFANSVVITPKDLAGAAPTSRKQQLQNITLHGYSSAVVSFHTTEKTLRETYGDSDNIRQLPTRSSRLRSTEFCLERLLILI
jgi:hypothetical protein